MNGRTLHIVRTTEMGPRALVLALLPTAVAANKGNEVIKFVVIGAAVQGRLREVAGQVD